ncbi:hypothetical protein Tco_1136889 [Tanacetum coccineum]
MDEEEDDEVTKELYHDVNVNLGNRDADMTDVDQGGTDQQNVSQESGFEQVEEDAHVTLIPVLDIQKTDEPVQSSSVSSDFTSKLLNLKNPSLADNEIASLMDTTARHQHQLQHQQLLKRHEEPRSQTSSLYTIPVRATPEVISFFTTTIPPPPSFFNPFPQQATPTLTPTTSEATTSFPSLLDFLFIFKFNDRVTNLEKDLLEIKQVEEYAQALSSIPAIVDRYIDNKLREAIQKAVMAHNLDCREEAQAEKRDYIEFILPQAVSDFATPVIEKNVTESLEATVLARGVDTTKTKIKTPPLDQTKGQKEGSQARKLSYPEIQDQRKRSLQALLKMPPTLNTSLLASPPMQKSQVIQLMTQECNMIKSLTCVTTWISQVGHAKEPRISFDELMDTSFDFYAFVLNRLNIKDLTQEILVGPAFELLKGTCKSLTELEYHLEECSKATTERLD